jgi:CRISPR-associated endonuclease/helicase Cas3
MDFAEAYSALTGHPAPLAWQRRLYEQLRAGELPEALDLPTGLGKTSVMALWLLALAEQMKDGGAPKLPRRLVYVVDRRAVVDQATEEAEKLRAALRRAELSGVRAALGLAEGEELPVSTLRGKLADNRAWLADPAKPAIIIGTVDMTGSRLLFSGYGVGRGMRPVHAAMLAVDSLFVLDESHLAPAFQKLLEQIAGGDDRLWPEREIIRPLRVLPLSATGEHKARAFTLTPEDEQDAIVRQRLHAAKQLELKHVRTGGKKDALAGALAQQALALAFDEVGTARTTRREMNGETHERAPRVIIYAHSREVALAVAKELRKHEWIKAEKRGGPLKADIELFTGARRVKEREEARNALKKLGFLAGASGTDQERPAFLVATAAAEVGVDLDADHMVGDLVALERMIQRMGRVNRLGAAQESRLVVLVDEDAIGKEKDKEQQARLQAAVRALEALRGDASPAALRRLQQERPELVRQASTPLPLYPPLELPHVEAWAMTSLPEHTGRPDIQPWLRGWVEEESQATIIWRAYLPWRSGKEKPLKRDVEAFFRAARPHLLEMVEAHAGVLADVLIKGAKNQLKQAGKEDENLVPEQTPALIVLSLAGDFQRAWSLAELAEEKKSSLMPNISGRLLVAAREIGGLERNGLLSKDAKEPPETLDAGWDEEWLQEIGFRVLVRTTDSAEPTLSPDWKPALEVVLERDGDGKPARWLEVRVLRGEDAEEGDPAIARRNYHLKPHLEDVAGEAAALARRLQLPSLWQDILHQAGLWHDMGKRRLLWQRAANAPVRAVHSWRPELKAEEAYAKTEGPFNGRMLNGYRHEFGSLLDALNDEELKKLPNEQRELVLHLIAAHHGYARPLIAAIDPKWPSSRLEQQAMQAALRFARLQRRFGPWGLAWLEALLRAADRKASARIAQNDTPASAAPAREGTHG